MSTSATHYLHESRDKLTHTHTHKFLFLPRIYSLSKAIHRIKQTMHVISRTVDMSIDWIELINNDNMYLVYTILIYLYLPRKKKSLNKWKSEFYDTILLYTPSIYRKFVCETCRSIECIIEFIVDTWLNWTFIRPIYCNFIKLYRLPLQSRNPFNAMRSIYFCFLFIYFFVSQRFSFDILNQMEFI